VRPNADYSCVGSGARRFTCSWHGWVYDTSGAVVGVPDREDFADDQISGICAPRVAVETWGGWIWVYLDPHAAMPSLSEWLGADVANDLGRYEMERMRVHAKETIELEVNWKVVVDGFNEMYHIDALHHVRPQDVKDGRESSFFVFGRNSMMIVPLGPGLHKLRDTGDHFDAAICHYVVFPNSVFNNGPLDIQLFHPVPLSATRTRFECWNLVYDHERGEADDEYDALVDRHWSGLRQIVAEDVFIFGEVNATRDSLGYTENRFNERECKPTTFHQHIDGIINGRIEP
jgi:phenylpropionate dioxygenase-like ring-hydroxylating dioxygenase large terminal subunit